MNEYFHKINLKFPEFTTKQLKGPLMVKYSRNNYHGTFIHHIADPDVLDYIKNNVPFPNPVVAYTEIRGSLVPHIDAGGTCAINYYLETNSADTTFYSLNEGQELDTISNGATLFNEANCKLVDKFHAEQYSSWILNIGKIHSVIQSLAGCRRLISIGYPELDFKFLVENLVSLEGIEPPFTR